MYLQISDLIPGETYTVRVTPYYSETAGSGVFPAESTEGTATLDRIGTYVMYLKRKDVIPVCIFMIL